MYVTIAVPAYTGTVHLETMRSLLHDTTSLMRRGDTVALLDHCQSSYIHYARAMMVAKFLASNSDVLVMIDHDVSWQADALLKIIDHPVDLCAGIYPKRAEPIEYPVRWIPEQDLYAVNGLLEVEGVPGGFTKYSRACLEKMVEAYKDLNFVCSESPTGFLCDVFSDLRLGNGHKLSEDFAFCARWRSIGGQVWFDPEIRMGHTGLKTFEGHLGEWLRNR